MRFSIDDPLVASFGEERGTGASTGFIHSFSWLFWTSVSPAEAWVSKMTSCEAVLEVLGHRLLEALFVLSDHARHAVELLDAPLVSAGDSEAKSAFCASKIF